MIARWLVPDKLAEHPDQIDFSPYHYVKDNSIRYNDPDGNCPVCLVWGAVEAVEAVVTATAVVATAYIVTKIVTLPHHADGTPVMQRDQNLQPLPAAHATATPYMPPRTLPRDPKTGKTVTDPEAHGVPHTQLGHKLGSDGKPYAQRRTFDQDGNPVKDVDHTDHVRPQNHPNPHQHRHIPNPSGSPQRGPAEPVSNN